MVSVEDESLDRDSRSLMRRKVFKNRTQSENALWMIQPAPT